mgnify:CR=1 FL=1
MMSVELNICPQCGAQFECGAKTGKGTCWCVEYPLVMPVPSNGEARCLCPDCLEKAVQEKLTQASTGSESG